MLVEKCVYNEVCDNNAVDQYGFVDLAESIKNGVVPSSISNTEDEYNGIEDPSTIIGKPHDVFEAYRMMDSIKTSGAKSGNNSGNEETE